MSEVSSARVLLGIPVVGQLDLGLLVPGSREKCQSEAPGFDVDRVKLDVTQLIDVELQLFVEVRNPYHGVQILHG